MVITRKTSPPFSSSIPQNIEGQSYITNSKVLREILGYVVRKEVIIIIIIILAYLSNVERIDSVQTVSIFTDRFAVS